MDAIRAIKIRRSIRSYGKRKIPRRILEHIADAARFAATARNEQPWRVVLVTAGDVLERLGRISDHGKFIAQAVACAVIFCRDTKYYLEDGSAATQNILVAAAASGVGSCWVAGDKKPYAGEISSLLGCPPSYKLVSLVALGYPEKPRAAFYEAEKKPLREVVSWEKF